jgi:hypothetical protein
MKLTPPPVEDEALLMYQHEHPEATVIPPLGVYGSEKQLSILEMVQLKSVLGEDPILAAKVCVHLAVVHICEAQQIARKASAEHKNWIGRLGVTMGVVRTSGDLTKREFQEKVNMMSAVYGMSLQQALHVPEVTGWPSDATPPATYAEALREISAQNRRGQRG